MKIRKLLYPFSLLYGGVTSLRNKLFDWDVLHSKAYSLPIISVGNITVGGTGKTPLTEYIIGLLKDEYKVTLLSRGYKRLTKGAMLANKSSSARSIGDEPFQIKQKFPEIRVAVAEKRVEGMELILRNTQTEVVLMDDAFQHRYVQPGLSILVIDYHRPMWNDCPFPAGDLRETSNGTKRADIIVVNKCPVSFSDDDKARWLKKLNPKQGQEVFFTSITYGQAMPVDSNNRTTLSNGWPVLGLAGIAQPEGFFTYLSSKHKLANTLVFPDHHHFSARDVEDIAAELEKGEAKVLITTEKDGVRFDKLPEKIRTLSWYIPIRLKVLFNSEKQFENRIRNYVRNNSDNS